MSRETKPDVTSRDGLLGTFRPQNFSGGDPDAFLRQFKRVARANGWSVARQLDVLPALFVGSYEWVADTLEGARPTIVEDAGKLISEKLCPREKNRERSFTSSMR